MQFMEQAIGSNNFSPNLFICREQLDIKIAIQNLSPLHFFMMLESHPEAGYKVKMFL